MSKSIDLLVQDCIIGFEDLYVQLENPDNHYIYKPEELVKFNDGRSRFARWSRNAGAGSLERKLQNNGRVKEQAIRLLSHIQRLLEDAHAITVGCREPWDQISDEDEENPQSKDEREPLISFPETEIEQVLAHIADAIDNLSYLGSALRETIADDRTKNETSHYEPFDIQHVRSKYPVVDEVIAERLGKAISARRQLFRGQQSAAAELGSHPEEGRLAGEPTLKGLTNQFTLVALTDQGSEHQEDFDEASSETSYIASDDLKARQIPPLPQRAREGELFRCHLCHKMVRGLSATAWNDLRPYLCLEQDCSMPQHRYARRKDWISHVLQEHWKIYTCCLGCNLRFASRNECREHLAQNHANATNPSEIEELVWLSTMNKTEIPDKTACPLCKKRLRSTEIYQSHIGKHQKQLALFAIPRGLITAHETPLQHNTNAGIHGLDPAFREAGTSQNVDVISLDKDQKERTAQAASELDEKSGTSMRTTDYFSIGKEADLGGRTQSELGSFAGSSSNPGRQRGVPRQWQCFTGIDYTKGV
ncbi:hypothetical protein FPRO04_12250 [Fusarium proliferatum]|nr:hypothetical protein FPRO03_09258 [Fusarium proliferatum]KAG4269071.1 hypothetical protein FPRO04_12250 [Fusarium proliferatum]